MCIKKLDKNAFLLSKKKDIESSIFDIFPKNKENESIFDLLMIDEAHIAENSECKHGSFLDRMNVKYRIAITATPFKLEDKYEENWHYSYIQAHMNNSEVPTVNYFCLAFDQMLVNYIKDNDITAKDFTFFNFFASKERTIKFIDSLCEKKNYPFSSDYMMCVNKHCLVTVDREKEADMLEEVLKNHSIISKHYRILNITGNKWNKRMECKGDTIYIANNINDHIKKAEEEGYGTIIITITRATLAVTVEKLTSVIFLDNSKSKERFIQTMFRANSTYKEIRYDKDGNPYPYMKTNSFVYDFAPNRILSTVVVDYLSSYAKKSCILNQNDLTSDAFVNAVKDVANNYHFYNIMYDESDMRELDADEVVNVCYKLKIKERNDDKDIAKVPDINYFFDTITRRTHDDVQNEIEACKTLNIKPGKRITTYSKANTTAVINSNLDLDTSSTSANGKDIAKKPTVATTKKKEKKEKKVNDIDSRHQINNIIYKTYLFAFVDSNFDNLKENECNFVDYFMKINKKDFIEYIGKFGPNSKMNLDEALEFVDVWKNAIVVLMDSYHCKYEKIWNKMNMLREHCKDIKERYTRDIASREIDKIVEEFMSSDHETVLTKDFVVDKIMNAHFEEDYPETYKDVFYTKEN